MKLPLDPRFEPPLQRAGEIKEDWHELVLPIIKIQNMRYRTLEELMSVVALKMEKRRQIEKEKQKEAEARRLKGIIQFQANVRRHQKQTKWLDLMEDITKQRDNEASDYRNKCAVIIQSLYRGFSVRIWVINLSVEDTRKFWYQIQSRKRIFMPSLIDQYLRESKKFYIPIFIYWINFFLL